MSKTILSPDEAAAHMLPSDLKKFEFGEHVAEAFSIAVGNPDETSVPLFTTTQAEAYAAAKVREAQRWQLIETAPHETLVVLGWYDENEVFKQEIALASAGRRYPGGASDMWRHGRATHWMPLPAPPLPGPVEPTT